MRKLIMIATAAALLSPLAATNASAQPYGYHHVRHEREWRWRHHHYWHARHDAWRHHHYYRYHHRHHHW